MPPRSTKPTPEPSFCAAPVTWSGAFVVVAFGEAVTEGLIDVAEVYVVASEVLAYDVVAEVVADTLEVSEAAELVVAAEEVVGAALEEVVDSGAGGGMTLKLTVAPH